MIQRESMSIEGKVLRRSVPRSNKVPGTPFSWGKEHLRDERRQRKTRISMENEGGDAKIQSGKKTLVGEPLESMKDSGSARLRKDPCAGGRILRAVSKALQKKLLKTLFWIGSLPRTPMKQNGRASAVVL